MASVESYFSQSYAEAREKFLAALEAGGGVLLESCENPNKGPDGGRLFTDVGRIGPGDARKILVLVSSTHGIEGYCGSGCQVGWLQRKHYWRDATPDVAVYLVHAVNPHGFAWGRRVTEENVDLNRNFVDFAAPLPSNPDYEALAAHVNPREWSDAAIEAADLAIARHYNLPNADFLPRAIHGGQYVNDKGTYFGGFAPTWARRNFEAIVARHFVRATDLCVIDYHTGLGPLGHGDIIFGNSPAMGRARDWFDHVTPTEEDIEAAKRKAGGHTANSIPGTLSRHLLKLLPQARLTAGGLEYGTHDVRNVLKSIRADNWLWAHGDPHGAQGREIRAFIREMFYPSVPEWKIMVTSRSNDIIRMALAGLARA
ncbi:MAG: M14 family metallopeptidase [Alphaproteobacteria bacterium]|nr:M14 family metallopeptidase [Alphaproteobacteria bacterium]